MKKLVSMMLILLVFCSFGGCAQKTNTNDGHNRSSADEVTTVDESVVTYNLSGEAKGDTYKNEYLGITFTKPKAWAYFPEDALVGLTGGNTELSVAENANTYGAAYDMMAVDYTTDTSVSIVFENLEVTSNSAFSAEEYLEDVIKVGVRQVEESTIAEETTVEIGGETYVKVVINTEDNNTPLTMIHYLRCVDVYMIHITATVPTDKADTVDFDAMFA